MKRWLTKAYTRLKLFCLKRPQNEHLTRRLIEEERQEMDATSEKANAFSIFQFANLGKLLPIVKKDLAEDVDRNVEIEFPEMIFNGADRSTPLPRSRVLSYSAPSPTRGSSGRGPWERSWQQNSYFPLGSKDEFRIGCVETSVVTHTSMLYEPLIHLGPKYLIWID